MHSDILLTDNSSQTKKFELFKMEKKFTKRNAARGGEERTSRGTSKGTWIFLLIWNSKNISYINGLWFVLVTIRISQVL